MMVYCDRFTSAAAKSGADCSVAKAAPLFDFYLM